MGKIRKKVKAKAKINKKPKLNRKVESQVSSLIGKTILVITLAMAIPENPNLVNLKPELKYQRKEASLHEENRRVIQPKKCRTSFSIGRLEHIAFIVHQKNLKAY